MQGSVIQKKAAEERSFQGIAVAGGICHGKALVYWQEAEQIPVHKISESDLPQEIAKFEAALIATRAELLDIQQKIASAIGSKDASIFDAHLLVVEDRTLIDEVLRKLEGERKNIEYVFDQVTERYCKTLQAIDDPYLRERVVDIEDVRKRVLRHLLGKQPYRLNTLNEPHIIIAHNLSPADTVLLNKKYVLGFATEVGSKTSHTAIMARSLDIPSCVGLTNICQEIRNDDIVVLDGYTGLLTLNPTPESLARYRTIKKQQEALEERLELIRDTISTTSDGRHIILSANIELPKDLEDVRKNGAEGVGLYRSEYLFLNRPNAPTEDEQYENYRLVAQRAKPHSVIIRSLDAGGDKFIDNVRSGEGERNPFLGCRAIRFCLQHPHFFKTQLRAILRAAIEGNIRLMYPMISGINELRRANILLEEAKGELKQAGVPFCENLEVGIMVEIPSAALTAHILAQEADFFSIGTNDLIQYTIAIDRVNERIAHLYEPTHPGVIRLIRMVVEAAQSQGIWVGVCGEMAGDIHLTPLLLGLGVDELSVGASLVPRVKKAVQSLNMGVCGRLAQEITQAQSGAVILEKCLAVAQAHYGELLF
ncbi:MAG: phosphoenolpyruvate--protein phosphotransferase [Verrucomicrobia bacterium]|nr:MAG: phosphoenolpyruvate--protein phosphotransferase [Verrucomicrobiota bacterium]